MRGADTGTEYLVPDCTPVRYSVANVKTVAVVFDLLRVRLWGKHDAKRKKSSLSDWPAAIDIVIFHISDKSIN